MIFNICLKEQLKNCWHPFKHEGSLTHPGKIIRFYISSKTHLKAGETFLKQRVLKMQTTRECIKLMVVKLDTLTPPNGLRLVAG